MRLNGLKLNGHFMDGDRPCFELDCSLAEISAIDGQSLTVTDDGDTVEEYFAYSISSINRAPEGTYFVWFARELDDASKTAIEQLEASVTQLHVGVASANDTAENAKEAAEAAQTAAENAGTDMQVSAFARIAVAPMAATMTDAQILEVSTLLPTWAEGVEYSVDDAVGDGKGGVYRCEQAHTSSAENNLTVASLWTKISVASDGIEVWQQPIGAHNAYSTGDRVHYPTADGPVYESVIDGNCWSPDAYPAGWQLVEESGGEEGGETEEPEPEPSDVQEFVQPTGAHDAYNTGDRVTYNGNVYESTMDGNVYSPDAYPQGWHLVEDGA